MEPQHKYARVERERRFLLERFPTVNVVRIRRITDCYIEGTTLRLRKQSEEGGPTTFKLTQKVPARASGAQEGLITSMYLTKDEFCVLAQLSAKKLSKTRHSVPPFGIDVFEGMLEGLLLGEAEFDSAAESDALTLPSFIGAEVSGDNRFTGGRLVRASRQDIQAWLLEYGSDSAHREVATFFDTVLANQLAAYFDGSRRRASDAATLHGSSSRRQQSWSTD